MSFLYYAFYFEGQLLVFPVWLLSSLPLFLIFTFMPCTLFSCHSLVLESQLNPQFIYQSAGFQHECCCAVLSCEFVQFTFILFSYKRL